MGVLGEVVDRVAGESGFSGVVRVEHDDVLVFEGAFGLADLRHEIPMRVDSLLAIASGTKALTAVAVMSLVQDGLLELGTPVRSFLGDDLPLVGEQVTVEHLLAHRSGIGDYLDEDEGLDLNAYLMPVPVHELASTQDYVRVLDGHPPKFAPGTGFSYCNAGYVVLALVLERVTGTPFHDVVRVRVCEPAGMADTAFLRSDELPGRAAVGYLSVDGAWRSNVFHLPVLGSGDGGIYSTTADVHRFWSALFGGRIIRSDLVEAMLRRRSDLPAAEGVGYGLGFWLGDHDRILTLEGYDAGVSYRSQHHRTTDLTWTVIANTTDGAWPVAQAIHDTLEATASGRGQ